MKSGPKTRWWDSRSGAHTVAKVKCICGTCGKVFYKYPSVIANGRGHYCSRKCNGKAIAASSHQRRKRFICTICGDSFLKYPGDIRGGAGHCCSESCAEKARNKTKVRRKCKTCDKTFYVAEAHTRGKHKAIYCSMPCLWKSQEGSNAPNWRGGISYGDYDSAFNPRLIREIKERDGYTCRLCDEEIEKGSRRLQVHHIDYDKKNSNPRNLVTLCAQCHGKTNVNREFWINQFSILVINSD